MEKYQQTKKFHARFQNIGLSNVKYWDFLDQTQCLNVFTAGVPLLMYVSVALIFLEMYKDIKVL